VWVTSTPALNELSKSECLDILRSAPIARVGLSIDALPAIFPVFITLIDDAIVFPTLAGTSLASGSMGSILALQVDTFDPVDEVGYSVLVRGFADELTDEGRAARARERLHPTWATDPRSQLIEITPTLLSGRRFGPVLGS
jgi:nitroimidazol reductase NimA-like FMN-containing flavoprotein (pyridoxamine 5'-phosphate oxidase superfamily)